MLPREVRERVFDPALADLTRAWLTERPGVRRLPVLVRVLGMLIRCVPIAVPRLFFVRGRLTKAGRIAFGGSVVVILLVLGLSLVQEYARYPVP